VPTDDAHQSEYVAACFKRRQFISQFSGSAGTALVTHDRAMLWTDGRYFLQAGKELDVNWTLMRDRVPGAVQIQDWLANELPSGSTVGFNSYLISEKAIGEMRAALQVKNIALRGLDADLVDEVRVCHDGLDPSLR
jgi:Xaa-Pro aminopeptidase